MENRGKLGNDDKVKFVGPRKMWDWERKLVAHGIYESHHFHFPYSFPFVNSITPNGP